MIVPIDYASPSVFESDRERALIGISTNNRRPARFHGRVIRNIPLLRLTLRALGAAVWSDDTWRSQGEFMNWALDPVITIHPDRLFLEAFSQDQSAYAMVIANPEMFATEGEITMGTTNVDFTAWLWSALNELRSSRETWLRVGPEGFEVATHGAGGRFEQNVELPDAWVRGFLEVSAAMARPGTRLTLRPADLLAAIRFLRYTKAKLSPRALRYEMNPGEDARIVLEPWEHVIPLRGTQHNCTEPRVIRTWGRRRLGLIEPLLPFATSVDVYLKGRGLPSFYAVKLPDLTFVLGLSGWTGQSWSDTTTLTLRNSSAADPDLTNAVNQLLANIYHAQPAAMAATLTRSPSDIWRACEELCRRGRAMFDVETRGFRHRELFEEPIDEARLFPPDSRAENAAALLAAGAVGFAQCEPQATRKTRRLRTPDGQVTREVIYRDWRIKGAVGSEQTEIVVNDVEQIIYGICTCGFFQDHLLGKGPCEHMLALFSASTTERSALRTSIPADAAAEIEASSDDEEKDDFDEEDFDEDNHDEKNDAR